MKQKGLKPSGWPKDKCGLLWKVISRFSGEMLQRKDAVECAAEHSATAQNTRQLVTAH